MRRTIVFVMLAAFFTNSFVSPSFAQSLVSKPGEMAALSAAVHAPVFKGVKVYPDNPFRFDFILDRGVGDAFDATVLVKYFLAALTVPNKDLWVNLSPYEKDRIVPEAFGRTQMGRDLLAQDYFLKQLTASLIYPENELGREFWDKVYKQAREQFGTSDIPVDTFNKVWIVPAKARVYENGAAAYVVESRLKVMLENDYLAEQQNALPSAAPFGVGQDVLRQVIIPALEKEVNEGANFAQVRQAYNSLILALWYKNKVKSGILAASYVDRKKISGVNVDDPGEAEKIWARYVEAFQKGAFDLIREEEDLNTREMIPRKYFSGGLGFDQAEQVLDLGAERKDVPSDLQAQIIAVNLEPDVSVDPKTADAAELSEATIKAAVEERVREVSKQEIASFKLTQDDVLVLKSSKNYFKDGSDPEKALLEKLATLSQRIKDGIPVRIDLGIIPNDAPSVEIVQALLHELYRSLDRVFVDFPRYNEDFSTMTFAIKELLKNAVIHGNKADLRQPVYVWVKYGAMRTPIIYVIDMGALEGPGLINAYKEFDLTGNNEGIATMREFGSYNRGNLSFNGQTLQAQYSVVTILDPAQAQEPVERVTGGIDLQPAEDILENSGAGIQFKTTPGGVDWDNVPGYIPVIISVQPLKDLPQFLGAN